MACGGANKIQQVHGVVSCFQCHEGPPSQNKAKKTCNDLDANDIPYVPAEATTRPAKGWYPHNFTCCCGALHVGLPPKCADYNDVEPQGADAKTYVVSPGGVAVQKVGPGEVVLRDDSSTPMLDGSGFGQLS